MLKKILIFWLNLKYRFIKGNPKTSKALAEKIIKENNLNKPSNINMFLSSKMKYVSDPLGGVFDTQQDLDATYNRNWQGDCDDYAAVVYRLVEAMGYEPYMLTLVRKISFKFEKSFPFIRPIWPNHVVCLFQKKSDIMSGQNYILIGNEGYEKYLTLKELLKRKNAIEYHMNKLK